MLNVSVVLYRPQWSEVVSLVETLLPLGAVRRIFLVDNSEKPSEVPIKNERITYIFNGKNLGYGAAHNIAIRESIYDDEPFHLVVNHDIRFEKSELEKMLGFMVEHPEIGSLMPKVTYPNGEIQYLCKLLPTPWDVFGRRFLPKRWMGKRNERYELRASGYDKIMNVPYLSGCFMLLRTSALQKVGIFDEHFFMYPEDIDLTRRIHREYLTVYFPHATIIHDHAKGSYHNLRLFIIHCVNMCRYFNKYGWIFDKERKIVNQLTLDSIRQ